MKHSILLLIFLCTYTAQLKWANAEEITVGRTYPVIEEDPVIQIKRRAQQHDWRQMVNQRKDSWKENYRTASLPRSQENLSRYHIPYGVAEKDVIDANGAVIYPAGFQFNPLEHIRMPYSIYVIDQKDIDWVKERITMKDMILISNGNVEESIKAFKGRTYILDEVTKERLNITHVPSVVEQVGHQLKISEYVNEH